MQELTSLFLSQSYKDAWDDYKRSIANHNFAHWDYIVLTASNEKQAEGFMAQIKRRQSKGYLPKNTEFFVISDPEGKRVGSGGATLGVIKEIAEKNGKCSFDGLRILVIHSGGDSKRVPQYSALGKLFSPVPRILPDGRASTLFDEFIIEMSSMPSRIREGMLLLSGDVLLLFNPLQIDFSGRGAAAISFKEDVETGKNHGVFLSDGDGIVKKFLHKQSVDSLKAAGAVNERNLVDIDTGAVIFAPEVIEALAGLISVNGRIDEDKFNSYVNDTVRLSLYCDFLYPLASESTLELFYKEKPEGSFCDELKEARTNIWKVLSEFKLKVLRPAHAKFIHFGTTGEILRLMSEGIDSYTNLGWNKCVCSSTGKHQAAYNSAVSRSAVIGKNCYLECSYVHHDSKVGEGSVLSFIDIHTRNVPAHVVVHGLKQYDGKFVVRIYGVGDNPKASLEDGCELFGKRLDEIMKKYKLSASDLWDSDDHTLWNAKLYPACNTIDAAVDASLNLYDIVFGKGDFETWKNSTRKSLCSGFNDADPQALIEWDTRMSELVQMDGVAKLICDKEPASKVKDVLKTTALTKIQSDWLDKRIKYSDDSLESFGQRIRLNYYIGKALGDIGGDKYISGCFKEISRAIIKSCEEDIKFNEECKIVYDEHTVNLPLRVNLGGGWSDTPPYCNENGGTVLNAAIMLAGKMPVKVTLKKLDEKKVIFRSRDMDAYGEFDSIEPLQRTGDPYDSFALQKAALLACGVIPKKGGNLSEILTRIGGGFILDSEVSGVPKGSGLGTSSILAAACVKAIFEFLGVNFTQSDLYGHVLCMEQIMSTGGGWQDQVGGLSEGIKFVTTKPGLKQKIQVSTLKVEDEVFDELNERYALIYTGQRRLARNLLREVVGRYIGNEPDSLYAINEVQKLAAVMRFEIERGNIDALAELMNEHWELSKKIDSESTNTLIDQIFSSIEDLIDGKMICGAGGGGFLQVIMKKGVSKEELHNRLKSVFEDFDVDVWDSKLV